MTTEKITKIREEAVTLAQKTCFIIMPISDVEGYEPGHFTRVYEYLIKPACLKAGFLPVRADEVKNTNFII